MTSIEELWEEIQNSIIPAQKDYFKWAFEKAKEMHKEEIIDAYVNGQSLGYDDSPKYWAEQYYQETFVSKGSNTLKDYHIVDTNEMVEQIPDVRKMVFPKDINGVVVKVGDKIQGIGSLKFQDGFEIDRTPVVTANMQNGKLYFGNLSAESFTLGFKIVESKMVEDDVEKLAEDYAFKTYHELEDAKWFTPLNVGFIAGYNKAKETLYTEEDMDNYAEYCTTHVLTTQTGHPYLSVKEWKSLKQPKQ